MLARQIRGEVARLEQALILFPDRRVALASGLPQPVEIRDLDVAAAVVDEIFLL